MVKEFAKASFLAGLKILSKLELAKHRNSLIIGITGSSGKTSCKEMLVAFLKPHYKDNLKYTRLGNSETRIPFEILNIPVRHYKIWEFPLVLIQGLFTVLKQSRKYDVFVIEYGIDGPHSPVNMEYLLSIVKPDIALLLSVTSVHGDKFEKEIGSDVPVVKHVEAIERKIAAEKFKLLQAVSDKKRAFLTKQAASFLDPKLYEGMTIVDDATSVHISQWENTSSGLAISLSTPKGEISTIISDVALPISSQQNVKFAVAVTTLLKKDVKMSLNKLSENYILEPGRSSLLPGLNGTIILDSSYNANPYAAKELFPLVKELAKKGRRKKIIVLGDFRELGSTTPQLYREIIKEAVKYTDILILTNTLMKEYGIPAAEDAGMVLNENLYWFENGKQLSFHINEVVEKNAIVLFEGSQNTVFLEYAVKELCANKDPQYILRKLPRMSNNWLGIR